MWPLKSQTNIKLDKILHNQQILYSNQVRLLSNQIALLKKLDEIEKSIHDVLLRIKPGFITLTMIGETAMADQIEFQVNLPPKSAPDVVRRELTVIIGGGDPSVYTVNGDTVVVDGLKGDQDSTVEVSLVDIDDSNNRSIPNSAVGILTDTFAPPQPGSLSIVPVGEVIDEPPVDEPPVDEPPVDEPPVDVV